MFVLKENQSKCKDYFGKRLQPFTKIKTDRVFISGRRGTGKSTGLKQKIDSEAAPVIWITDTVGLSETLPARFVPPAVAHLLPTPELVAGGDFPLFRFGSGAVRLITWRQIHKIRETGIDVDGKQAVAIIHDEAIRRDTAYIRDEPYLLDDLAVTLGRSGVTPVIVVAGNPNPYDGGRYANANPYSFSWRVDILAEATYTHEGRTTQVIGTADCKDCFGRAIGLDATKREYAPHLDAGGDLVSVDGVTLRIREIAGGVYVGLAGDEQATPLMVRGRLTADTFKAKTTRFLLACRRALDNDTVVFDSFEAQVAFYRLLNVR